MNQVLLSSHPPLKWLALRYCDIFKDILFELSGTMFVHLAYCLEISTPSQNKEQ